MEEHTRLYEGQEFVQVILVIVAFTCVPVMLLAKPLLKRLKMQRKNGVQINIAMNH